MEPVSSGGLISVDQDRIMTSVPLQGTSVKCYPIHYVLSFFSFKQLLYWLFQTNLQICHIVYCGQYPICPTPQEAIKSKHLS